MEAVTFGLSLLADASPTPSPSGAAGTVLQQLSSVDYGGLAQDIVKIIASVTSNPILSLVGVGVVTLVGGLVWFFLGAKIKAWLQGLAQDATNQGKDDFVSGQTPVNQDNTNKDNDNRGKIDNAP